MRNEFQVEKTYLKLTGDRFYGISISGFYPLWYTRARLVEQDRDLSFATLAQLREADPKFISTTGSPYAIVTLSPTLVMPYPCYSTAGGVIELECVGTRSAYAGERTYQGLGAQFEEALVHYGKCFLYLRTAGGEEKAMKEFQEYLRLAGTHQELGWHKRAVSIYRLKALGE
jgi:hypothetical protein